MKNHWTRRVAFGCLAAAGLSTMALASPASAAGTTTEFDLNGDGHTDLVHVDLDGDGNVDEVERDLNHDGVFDRLDIIKDNIIVETHTSVYSNGEFYDHVTVDRDGDGQIDERESDLNGDGVFDVLRIYRPNGMTEIQSVTDRTNPNTERYDRTELVQGNR